MNNQKELIRQIKKHEKRKLKPFGKFNIFIGAVSIKISDVGLSPISDKTVHYTRTEKLTIWHPVLILVFIFILIYTILKAVYEAVPKLFSGSNKSVSRCSFELTNKK